MIILDGIVNQTIIKLFIVDERVKLKRVNYFDFMDKTFLHGTSLSLAFSKWSVYSPDLNLIKNLWSFVKMKLYEGGK